jgi:addiction module HigA family antidote
MLKLSTTIDARSSKTTSTRVQNGMRPIHPGEILREEYLVPLRISSNQLASALHVPANRISMLVRCQRTLTADTALRLARYFGTTAEFWLNLQRSYDLRTAQVEAGAAINREVHPRRA